MSKPKKYQPKGGMCAICRKRDKDCSQLGFNRMPVIERNGPTMIVRCKEFTK